jgi:hypothetical protein
MLQGSGDVAPKREVKFAPGNLQTVEADGTFTGYASVFGQGNLGQELVAGCHFRRGPKTENAGAALSLAGFSRAFTPR